MRYDFNSMALEAIQSSVYMHFNLSICISLPARLLLKAPIRGGVG